MSIMTDNRRRYVGLYVSQAEYRKIERDAKGNLSNYFRAKLGLKPGNRPGRPRKETA